MLHKTMIAVAMVGMLAAVPDAPVNAQENADLKSAGKPEGAPLLRGNQKWGDIDMKRGASTAAKPAQAQSLSGKPKSQRLLVPAVQKIREVAPRR